MPEDPNVVSKAALLQSITTEASGFYGQIVTVASVFLGGSLLFLEKIAPVRTGLSLLFLAPGWLALVASIGCVVSLRHMNLMAGRLAMDGKYHEAGQFNRCTDRLSVWSLGLLILGMVLLMVAGILNVVQGPCTERNLQVSEDKAAHGSPRSQGGYEKKTIPYGSTGPNAQQPTTQGTQTPTQPQSQPTPAPDQSGSKK
jgi:hypothetical protein